MSSKKCMLALGFDANRDNSNVVVNSHRSVASQNLVNNLTYQAFLQQLKWQSFLPTTNATSAQNHLYSNPLTSPNHLFRQLSCYNTGVQMNPYLTANPYFYQNALLQQAMNSAVNQTQNLSLLNDSSRNSNNSNRQSPTIEEPSPVDDNNSKSEVITKCDTSIKSEPVDSHNQDSLQNFSIKTSPHSSATKNEKPLSPEDSTSNCSDEWRPLRSRSFLSDDQVVILQNHFRRNPFPNKYELSALADQINVGKRVVQVWFQVIV